MYNKIIIICILPSEFYLQIRVDRIHVDGLNRTKNDVVDDATSDLLTANTFREVLSKAHKARLKLEKISCFKDISILIDVSKGSKATSEGLEVNE